MGSGLKCISLTPLSLRGGLWMGRKKNKSRFNEKKTEPSVINDQIGENAGEGRFEKSFPKNGKSR